MASAHRAIQEMGEYVRGLEAENKRLREQLAECEDALRFTDEECGKRGDQLDRLARVLGDVDAVVAQLPQEERDAHARAQQSVIDARRSANAIEGQIIVGATASTRIQQPEEGTP